MTTRRTVLQLAAAATLAGCSARTPEKKETAVPGDLLFVTTAAGLAAVDAGTGRQTLSGPAVLATPDWDRMVTAQADGAGLRLVIQEARTGQVMAGARIRDRLTPRVISSDGQLVALTTPKSGNGRTETTIVVLDSGGERVRLTLAGNLEPEAFSTGGEYLFALDYLPPAKPDRYRVRMIDLSTGKAEPLLTRAKVPVPAGAEETMRAQGRQAVYDEGRKMLFTLYTHQPDHLHTRDLLDGVRADKPHVHAFVHSLNLEQNWAYCIDLPSPFGEGPAAGHTIVSSHSGEALYVLDGMTGKVARLDPVGLTVGWVQDLVGPGLPGEVSAVTTADDRLVVAVGTQVLAAEVRADTPPAAGWHLPSAGRGIALGTGSTVYIGQDGAVGHYDLTTGQELGRVVVPGLVALRHVTTAGT